MLYPFLLCNSTVVFHSATRKTTVNKNGHNFRYAHFLLKRKSVNKTLFFCL